MGATFAIFDFEIASNEGYRKEKNGIALFLSCTRDFLLISISFRILL